MSKFEEYSKIENSYRQKFLDYLANYDLISGKWVVQEKIHGTNFQIYYDGKEFKAGSRTRFIDETSKFYGNCWLSLAESLKPAIRKIYQNLGCKKIIIYSELFGGSYEHKDVVKSEKAKRIQKGVFYSQFNELYVFDIKADDIFLNVEQVRGLCEAYDIFYAKGLFYGTLEECLQYSNKFQTTIPELLGLPPIDDNICEGIVIKPIEAKFIPNSGNRAILKSKNERYADKQSKLKIPRKVIPLTIEGQRLFDAFNELITIARLDSVMSRGKEFTNKDFGDVIDLVFKDIIVDFWKDEPDAFDFLENEERKIITKRLRRNIVDTIRIEYFTRV